MNIRVRVTIALAAVLIGPGTALAATSVIGNGLAAECSSDAIAGKSDKASLDICNLALSSELLLPEDSAKTHVNRGVILLRRDIYDKAERDFDEAQRISKDIPEVYVNRGAVRIRQNRFQDAVAEIDKGLAMGPSEPEKAYFDRGLAREALNDIKGAYLDYSKAAELKPDWKQPKIELARFKVGG